MRELPLGMQSNNTEAISDIPYPLSSSPPTGKAHVSGLQRSRREAVEKQGETFTHAM